jgi:lipopolysaccharide/colanic/teichoic acid biosynthesis glycosyltransferase
MRRWILLLADIALVLLATLAALVLRENLEFSRSRLIDFLPYLAISGGVSALIFPLMGLNRAVWRFSDVPDYVRVSGAVVLVVGGTLAVAFAFNRLEGVSRSLPVLQILIAIGFLVCARVLHRLRHHARMQRRRSVRQLEAFDEKPSLNILIVGVNSLAETYLQAVADLASDRIRVAGLAGRTERQKGRLVASQPVLGMAEDIEQILDELEVHGVHVDRIVVAASLQTLSQEAREALYQAERARPVQLQILTESLGLEDDAESARRRANAEIEFKIEEADLRGLSRRAFWQSKRAADAAGAFVLLLLCLPIMGAAALLVAATVGFPLIFWQERPGLCGRPFRVYKFRTMLNERGIGGGLLTDEERTSPIGAFLRRTRLDELPQLFNILRGDMSFIGPRPLLASDQSEACRARLLVRPGLSGWAQVVGGRDISAKDKAALDVWYVHHADFALDLTIALRTVPLVLFGERISRPLIERAWVDLRAAGIVRFEPS